MYHWQMQTTAVHVFIVLYMGCTNFKVHCLHCNIPRNLSLTNADQAATLKLWLGWIVFRCNIVVDFTSSTLQSAEPPVVHLLSCYYLVLYECVLIPRVENVYARPDPTHLSGRMECIFFRKNSCFAFYECILGCLIQLFLSDVWRVYWLLVQGCIFVFWSAVTNLELLSIHDLPGCEARARIVLSCVEHFSKCHSKYSKYPAIWGCKMHIIGFNRIWVESCIYQKC